MRQPAPQPEKQHLLRWKPPCPVKQRIWAPQKTFLDRLHDTTPQYITLPSCSAACCQWRSTPCWLQRCQPQTCVLEASRDVSYPSSAAALKPRQVTRIPAMRVHASCVEGQRHARQSPAKTAPAQMMGPPFDSCAHRSTRLTRHSAPSASPPIDHDTRTASGQRSWWPRPVRCSACAPPPTCCVHACVRRVAVPTRCAPRQT